MLSSLNKYNAIGIVFLIAGSIAGKNYIIWFWRLIGECFQLAWEILLDYVDEDPVTFWVYGTMLVLLVTYWSEGLLYLIMDLTEKPRFLAKYKAQPVANKKIYFSQFLEAASTVLFNQTIVAFPVAHLMLWFMEKRGYPAFRRLPDFQTIIVDVVVMGIAAEIVHYYSHKWLHHKLLYKHIHKKHHVLGAPVSVDAMYCHPLEHVFANMASLNTGFMIWGPHVFSVYVFYIVAISKILNAHCGYYFPLPLIYTFAAFHDYHHIDNFTECFGVLGIMDYILGTDTNFQKSLQVQKHGWTKCCQRICYPETDI